MNKLALNIGLSLIFSTSLLVGDARANTTVDPDDLPSQTQSQTQTKQTNTDPDDAQNSGYTQVVNTPKPEYNQDSTSKTKKKKPKTEESKLPVQSLATVLASFLGQNPSNSGSEPVDTSPSTETTAPAVEVPEPAPKEADESDNPQNLVQSHKIQGVLLDITPNEIVVRYKSFQKAGSKSKSAAKRSIAKMVKTQNSVQVMSLSLQRLDPSALETLDEKLFENCKFIYEMDETGARFVTGIK
jgi:hypothetical protein